VSSVRHFKTSENLARTVRTLHPELKRRVRAGLSCILRDPDSGKDLKGELAGLRSYRVGRLRIIYAFAGGDRDIELVAIGPRSTIYQDTLVILGRGQRENDTGADTPPAPPPMTTPRRRGHRRRAPR